MYLHKVYRKLCFCCNNNTFTNISVFINFCVKQLQWWTKGGKYCCLMCILHVCCFCSFCTSMYWNTCQLIYTEQKAVAYTCRARASHAHGASETELKSSRCIRLWWRADCVDSSPQRVEKDHTLFYPLPSLIIMSPLPQWLYQWPLGALILNIAALGIKFQCINFGQNSQAQYFYF